ncbi:thiamine-monophosphate kinase [Halostagnicola larsenii XH-48]|uniref:Thiamine-monophosphate kinase n=1 Tax=Halostagnicola larsenii XH-48 TaxID=797299 RepID=W0JNU2_9EURY|nr:thiamine-phosphate kinase [Halostagnicola larsenii]AHG00376.1 thiamine-monophosphate kinase [Halostagnicola larsenii XH-48]
MDERAALAVLEDELGPVGDDAAVVSDLVVTTDMLHETTDFPPGTTRYTAGWRAVGASLSDVAAMGGRATAAVAAYAAPEFDESELLAFVRGASDVCDLVGAEYVGGDLDGHEEFTVATTAFGTTDAPVRRSGAEPGDLICVTGTLGRSAAALELFERADSSERQSGSAQTDTSDREADLERANELFRFEPRVDAGRTLAPHATAMMDSSDGLARSLYQLAEASECGFAVDSSAIPIDDAVFDTAETDEAALERAITFGEDFELVVTIPEAALESAEAATTVALTPIGTVVDDGITMDGEPLPDRGYTHG